MSSTAQLIFTLVGGFALASILSGLWAMARPTGEAQYFSRIFLAFAVIYTVAACLVVLTVPA